MTGGTAPARRDEIWPRVDDPAVRVGETVLSYRDLLAVGAVLGLLQPVVAHVRRTTIGDPLTSSGIVDSGDLRLQAAEYRRARHLESGEDFRQWLTARGLDSGAFYDYLARRAIGAATASSPPPPGHDAERSLPVLYAELAFGGSWRLFAARAAELLTAERLLDGSAEEPARATDPAELASLVRTVGAVAASDEHWCRLAISKWEARRTALIAARTTIASSAKVEERIRERRLEWTALVFDELAFRSRDAALEAISLARVDGLTVPEIAERASTQVRQRAGLREQLMPEEALALDKADEGIPVGPVEQRAGWSVLVLHTRRPATPEDEALRERATSEIVEEWIADAMAGTVSEVGLL